MIRPEAQPLPVLVEERVWPEFRDAVRSLAPRWEAPSGHVYLIELDGARLVVSVTATQPFAAPPPLDEVDDDLLELACTLQDLVGEPWSGEALRMAAVAYGWDGRPPSTVAPADQTP